MSKKQLNKLSKKWQESMDSTVKSGFPVTVWFDLELGDSSIGVSKGIDDYEITTLYGSSIDWLGLSDSDIQALIERVEDRYFSYA